MAAQSDRPHDFEAIMAIRNARERKWAAEIVYRDQEFQQHLQSEDDAINAPPLGPLSPLYSSPFSYDTRDHSSQRGRRLSCDLRPFDTACAERDFSPRGRPLSRHPRPYDTADAELDIGRRGRPLGRDQRSHYRERSPYRADAEMEIDRRGRSWGHYQHSPYRADEEPECCLCARRLTRDPHPYDFADTELAISRRRRRLNRSPPRGIRAVNDHTFLHDFSRHRLGDERVPLRYCEKCCAEGHVRAISPDPENHHSLNGLLESNNDTLDSFYSLEPRMGRGFSPIRTGHHNTTHPFGDNFQDHVPRGNFREEADTYRSFRCSPTEHRSDLDSQRPDDARYESTEISGSPTASEENYRRPFSDQSLDEFLDEWRQWRRKCYQYYDHPSPFGIPELARQDSRSPISHPAGSHPESGPSSSGLTAPLRPECDYPFRPLQAQAQHRPNPQRSPSPYSRSFLTDYDLRGHCAHAAESPERVRPRAQTEPDIVLRRPLVLSHRISDTTPEKRCKCWQQPSGSVPTARASSTDLGYDEAMAIINQRLAARRKAPASADIARTSSEVGVQESESSDGGIDTPDEDSEDSSDDCEDSDSDAGVHHDSDDEDDDEEEEEDNDDEGEEEGEDDDDEGKEEDDDDGEFSVQGKDQVQVQDQGQDQGQDEEQEEE